MYKMDSHIIHCGNNKQNNAERTALNSTSSVEQWTGSRLLENKRGGIVQWRENCNYSDNDIEGKVWEAVRVTESQIHLKRWNLHKGEKDVIVVID